MERITNTHMQVLKRAGPDRIDFGGSVHLAVAPEEGRKPAFRASLVAVTRCISVG
jgi:hypothetical protein